MHTEISMDKAGRVVIPKSMRDSLGLRPDDRLDALQENGHIILTPARSTGYLKKKDDMWVWSTDGKVNADFDIVKLIHDMREERTRHILGLPSEE